MRKLILMAVVMAALPCLAGVTFIARTRSDAGEGVKVRGLVSGTRVKVVFLASQNDAYTAGEYMLSRDGGKTLYMVSPATRTYTKYDVQAMMSGMGSMVQGMRGQMKVSFDSPRVEKLLDEDGGLIAGLPTRHYRYRTSYSSTIYLAGAQKVATTVEEDIWTTAELLDPALGVWLKKEPPHTGDVQLDTMIAAEMAKVEGFPLKRVTVTRTTDSQGVEHTERSEMEVLELKRAVVPAREFLIPAGYHEVQPRRGFEHPHH